MIYSIIWLLTIVAYRQQQRGGWWLAEEIHSYVHCYSVHVYHPMERWRGNTKSQNVINLMIGVGINRRDIFQKGLRVVWQRCEQHFDVESYTVTKSPRSRHPLLFQRNLRHGALMDHSEDLAAAVGLHYHANYGTVEENWGTYDQCAS